MIEWYVAIKPLNDKPALKSRYTSFFKYTVEVYPSSVEVMFTIIIYQYLVGVFGVSAYDRLYENDLRTGHPLVFDVPRWITINQDNRPNCPNYPNCILSVQSNWIGETHPDIIGHGSPLLANGSANPAHIQPGIAALLPRYYVNKRLTNNNRVQIVALLNPEADLVAHDIFETQLLSIFCHQGTIEAINLNTVRWNAQHMHPGSCGIEEKLVEICLLDANVGSLPNPVDKIFQYPQRHPGPNVRPLTIAKNLVNNCERFYVIELPVNSRLQNSRVNERLLQLYLKAAQKAGFGHVLVHGLGVRGCAPNQLGWGVWRVDYLLPDQWEIRDLRIAAMWQYRRGYIHPVGDWYFCRYI